MNPSDYSQIKRETEKIGHTILQIAQTTRNTAVADLLDEVLDKLPKEEFYVAILGLFKRGKSTLINAMLGQAIVPTGVIPVTSVITRIRYSDTLTAKISFGNGSEKQVSQKELPQYITEAGNPDNTKNVTIADVYVPAPILEDGLILIDTPGVGSTYLQGTKVTFQFLDRVDFGVLVLAVDPPVGQQEMELFNSFAAKANRTLVVLNKVDYVDSASVYESVQYCQKVIGRNLGNGEDAQLKIYPLSAKLALEGRLRCDTDQIEKSGINPFETTLKQSLINEKQKLIIESANRKLQKAVSDLTTYVRLEINSLTTPLDNLSSLRLEFEQYLKLVQQRKRELFYVLEGKAKEVVCALDEDLVFFKKAHEDALVKQVLVFAEKSFKSPDKNTRKIVCIVEEQLREALIQTYSEFIKNEDRKIENAFQQIASEASENTRILLENVQQKAVQLFGVQAVESTFNASLEFETKFYYHLDPIFMTGVSFSGGEIAELLPKSLFKGILEKRIDGRVRDEFDKNGGRIRYDYFIARLNHAFLQLKRSITQALDSSTETVQHALQEAERLQAKSNLEVNGRVEELKEMLLELELIRKQLDEQFKLGI